MSLSDSLTDSTSHSIAASLAPSLAPSLADRHVVVIGASSGVGLAFAQRARRAGARVTGAARDAAKLAAALGGEVAAHAVDASDRSSLEGFFASIDPIDHLVLTLSGGEGAGPFAELDLSALRRGFEAKFWPQLNAAQAGAKHLRPHGSLTFVTAISARIARPGTAGLAAINGSIEVMIGALARELAPIRVNAVSPGVLDTAWWDRVPADVRRGVFEEQAKTLPVGRVGSADDAAHAIQFVVENGFVTGNVIECDGGLHLL